MVKFCQDPINKGSIYGFWEDLEKIKSKSISCQLKSESRSHADGSQLGVQLDGLRSPGDVRWWGQSSPSIGVGPRESKKVANCFPE